MIEEILPAVVAAEEAFDDPPCGTLFPEEEALLTRAVDKRRREFTTARVCARRAFSRLGVDPAPILPGPRGVPQWPSGLVGSMTHCAGYRAAALAPTSELLSLGIDGEPNEPVPGRVFDLISLPDERDHLAGLDAVASGGWPGIAADRLLFSAKESVFKAWYPLTGRELEFSEATVRFNPDDQTFHARLLTAPGTGPSLWARQLTGFSGRWTVDKGLIVTAIAVTADGSDDAGHPVDVETNP